MRSGKITAELPKPVEKEEETDITFVIVYDFVRDNKIETYKRRRRVFEKNLQISGVRINKDYGIRDPALCFVKLSLSWDTLLTYADIMKMKMPLKVSVLENPRSGFEYCMSYFTSLFELPDCIEFRDRAEHLSVFRKDKINMFDVSSKTSFSVSQKNLIAYEILTRTSWSNVTGHIGIHRLMNNGVYLAAYPLHEGKYKAQTSNIDELTSRQILYQHWAQLSKFYKYQPLPLIKKYFGEKIAVYFAWLGLYTLFLIPPSIIGLLGFIYSISNFGKDTISLEICNNNTAGSFVMCPLCDKVCTYWKLFESCLFFKIANVFDNDFTIFFSIFMSLWGTVFLQFWNRKEKELQFKWSTNDYEEEEMVRAEFELHCKYQRNNIVTNETEWYMRSHQKYPRIILSLLSVIIMISMVIGINIAVILIRISFSRFLHETDVPFINSYINIFTSVVAALMNLCAILFLDNTYRIIAIWLTNFENPRTETDYDDSFTWKVYSFQFLNYYASLFYIAFFKGTFIGRPGYYLYTFGWRQEECDPAGCMVELCIQMLVIFVGKQVMNNIVEYSLPCLQSRFYTFLYKFKHRKTNKLKLQGIKTSITESSGNLNIAANNIKGAKLQQWEKDFHLVDSNALDLFDEYLEMVIQFGFVTFFAASMPLAPLFALLNNIFELRMDAYKMLTRYRRPIPRKAQNIGIWKNILQVMTIIAVVTNGFIISYTSTAIPRMVYKYYYSNNTFNLYGYVNFSLSYFNVSDFQSQSVPNTVDPNLNNTITCRYKDFRNSAESNDGYDYSSAYWHVLAARLSFVIIFEHLVFFIDTMISWVIPDMPSSVKIRIEREKHLHMQLIYQEGTSKFLGDDIQMIGLSFNHSESQNL